MLNVTIVEVTLKKSTYYEKTSRTDTQSRRPSAFQDSERKRSLKYRETYFITRMVCDEWDNNIAPCMDITAFLDTGATVSLISERLSKKIEGFKYMTFYRNYFNNSLFY